MTDRYETCGDCGHYPAYCSSLGCTAWDPEAPAAVCGCAGWTDAKLSPLVLSNRSLYEEGLVP